MTRVPPQSRLSGGAVVAMVEWWVAEIAVVVVVVVAMVVVVVVVVVVHPLNKSISPRPNARCALFNGAHSEYKFRAARSGEKYYRGICMYIFF